MQPTLREHGRVMQPLYASVTAMTARSPGPRRGITFRLPERLHAELTLYAEQTHRSMNAALVSLLEQGLRTAAQRGEYTPPAEPHHAA
jgi:hypothetical protein